MQSGSTILLIEDSEDDVFFFQRALRAADITHNVYNVQNGRDARDYLLGRGRFSDRQRFPFPGFIIADNCTAEFNGLDFLRWLRTHPECRVIPCVMLSGSCAAPHIEQAYELGAHSYFEKPSDIASLQELVKLIFEYWKKALVPEAKAEETCAKSGGE